MRLTRENTARMAGTAVSLMRLVRKARWSAALLQCAVLLRLTQVQLETERILSRHQNKGGSHGHRR